MLSSCQKRRKVTFPKELAEAEALQAVCGHFDPYMMEAKGSTMADDYHKGFFSSTQYAK